MESKEEKRLWEHRQKGQIYKGKKIDCHEIFQCFIPANNRITFKRLKENTAQGFYIKPN